MNRYDWIVVFGIILLAGLTLFGFSRGDADVSYASVYHNNQLILELDLAGESYTKAIPGLPQVLYQVDNGTIAIVQSDCADQVCIHTGAISGSNQLIACVPHKLLIKIQAQKSSEQAMPPELDGIVR